MNAYFLYVSLRMGAPKPYLQAACFCERVIIDRADMSASVIRILGRIDVQLPKNWPDKLPIPEIQANLFAAFGAGDYQGSGKISIVAVGPDGKRVPAASQDVTLNAAQITNVTANIRMGGALPGIHWFEIYWDDVLETKVPLLVDISKVLPEVPNLPQPTA